MLDFKLLREKRVTIVRMSSELSREDLKQATHDMLDTVLNLIRFEGITACSETLMNGGMRAKIP